MATRMFTHWGREMDGPGLELIVRDGSGIAVERVELDVRNLPDFPYILDRMPEVMRERMLWEANEIRDGRRSFNLGPKYDCYEPYPRWGYTNDQE